jgi:hypothetical protein
MDYIQKTLEKLNYYHGQMFEAGAFEDILKIVDEALTEQANLFRKGLGEEIKEDKRRLLLGDADDQMDESWAQGSNSRRTQTLENWQREGL